MKLVYFAWVRDHTGCADEEISLPDTVSTVAELAEHLAQRSEGYHKAFCNLQAVRVAVNKEFASLDILVSDSDEVAFFPPVTGG